MMLTRRERQIVELLWEGHGNESIASQLDCSLETVKKHVSNIRTKTATNNRLDMAMKTFKEAHTYERKSL
jgi:DNA-binding NarL/FixJ family response regulator